MTAPSSHPHFKKGDTVFTQDGTNYYFDHVAGNHACVYPIIIIQTTNYRGDDFEEHEEVADHMVPIALDKISKTPWVRKTHEETAAAISEKKAVLDDLNSQIGAARTELRVTENNMEELRKELERDARDLNRRFQWVRDFKRLVGDETAHILTMDQKIPFCCAPFDVKLSRDSGDPFGWKFKAQYEDGDADILIFGSEDEMRAHVSKVFEEEKPFLLPEGEIAWKKRWPHLTISEAVESEMQAAAELRRIRKVDAAKQRLAAAQAEVYKLTEGEK